MQWAVMIKHTVEISREPVYLCVRNNQLEFRKTDEVVRRIPCEDIGVVLVDHPQTTYTHAALIELIESDAAVVICGRNHLPIGLLLPLSDHTNVAWRIRDQIKVRKPLLKQLWRQIIQAKIRASALNLQPSDAARAKLLEMAQMVRSGDPTNIEAQAAKVYWRHWLPDKYRFKRDIDADGLNSFLNYGYSVVRAALARALVASGLLPAIGIKHSNRSNAFALVDDLIEPLRAAVDWKARELLLSGSVDLDQKSKSHLLSLLAEDFRIENENGPLMVCLHRYSSSLVRCYQGKSKILEIPEFIPKLPHGESGIHLNSAPCT